MENHWHSNGEQDVKPRAEFQAAIMKLWESVRRSGQLIQSLNRDNEHLTAKLGEMDQHMRERASSLAELQVRLGTLEGDLADYENLQNNFQLSQENVNEAFLKIRQLERENADLRQQVENFAELEKSLSILQKEIVRRNAEMNTRINESFKQKAQIAELESKVLEINSLRAQLDEARDIIAQGGNFKNVQPDSELEEIIAAQQETIDSFSRQIFELKKAQSGAPQAGNFESPFKNFDEAAQNVQQQGFLVDFDSRVEEAVDAVRQEEEKLRDEYEIIMVRQQEALDKYAENLLKAEKENAEKDELLKEMQAQLGEFEQAYTQQADLIAGLQMEVELLKEQESGNITENENNDTQSLTIMIQEISEQKQRAEFERNEIAEELLKTRQMFALAQEQIQDLQKIEDEYARMQAEHTELRGRVDELQNSQKKNDAVSQAIQTLEEKIAELQSRFKNEETAAAPKVVLKEEILQEEKKLPEDVPFKKPETTEPEVRPEIEETELPGQEITETEPEEPVKKQPETKPRKVAKEKTAQNPAKDMVIDRMAALLERLEKSIV